MRPPAYLLPASHPPGASATPFHILSSPRSLSEWTIRPCTIAHPGGTPTFKVTFNTFEMVSSSHAGKSKWAGAATAGAFFLRGTGEGAAGVGSAALLCTTGGFGAGEADWVSGLGGGGVGGGAGEAEVDAAGVGLEEDAAPCSLAKRFRRICG